MTHMLLSNFWYYYTYYSHISRGLQKMATLTVLWLVVWIFFGTRGHVQCLFLGSGIFRDVMSALPIIYSGLRALIFVALSVSLNRQ